MLRSLLACALLISSGAVASAAEHQFPYEAVVVGDDVVARSGPGKNYYATSRLARETRVTVHRHDPGGWFMITPPPGSISWIEAALVERQGARGIVNVPPDEQGRPGQAVVRIGSTLSDDHGYTGRRLNNGDEVEILGEATLAMPQGPVRMLQITPPLREYRWVKGDFVVPADAGQRQLADNDPYAVPSRHRGSDAAVAIANQELPSLPAPSSLSAKAAPKAKKATEETAETSPEVLATHSQRMQLLEIDNRYADMMSLDISQWRLGDLRMAYENLRGQVDPGLASKIDVRLAALAEREKLYSNYAQFTNLAAVTEQRDAELLGMAPPQTVASAPATTMMAMAPPPVPGPPAAMPPSAPQMVTTLSPAAVPAVQLGAPSRTPPAMAAASAPQPMSLPSVPSLVAQGAIVQAGGFGQAPASGGIVQASGTQSAAPGSPQFAGAGILQATNMRGPGVPQFMITATDGRFLAFVDSPQVDLRPYIGQSVGLSGARAHQPRLRGDLIQVQSMTPVTLAGAR